MPPKQKPMLTASAAPVRSRRAASAASDVRLHRVGARLLHVRHVLEVLAARAEPGRAAEVVDGDRVVAGLGEALGELGVEGVEAADVGEDHDRAPARLGRLGERGREARPVGGGQLEQLRARSARDPRPREVGG